MKKHLLSTGLKILLVATAINHANAQSYYQTESPFLGWNSYDCYGSHINEKYTNENQDAFIQKLKPYGYEYFVLDAGWFRHYDLKSGEEIITNSDHTVL